MTMGTENARGTIGPLYAGGHGHRAHPGSTAGIGRTADVEAAHRAAAKNAGIPPGSPMAGGVDPGSSNPPRMGNGPSGRVTGSVGYRNAGRDPGQSPVSPRPPAYHPARAGLMMCVGALVVAAIIRQYEAWMVNDHPVLRADVVPGIMPDDPIVTFRIGQR